MEPEDLTLDGLYILDDENRPVSCPSVLEWGRWMQANEHRKRIAHDMDEGVNGERIEISTIFMGTDMRLLPRLQPGPPVLWETMVFGRDDILEQRRYTSHDEAFVGHQEVCREFAAARKR